MGYRSKYTGSQLENILDNAQNKQDKISDLETIRSGARKGATALQSIPSEYITETELNNKGYATISALDNKMDKVTLATVATTGNYNDLSNKPTIPSAVTESTVSGWGFAKSSALQTKAEDSSVVHKTGNETITGAKTFNGGVNFLGSGDSNAVTLSTNTRINVNGTNKTVLGFGSGTFYINHGDYNLLLRGKATRPTYNNADMAMLSDVNGKQDKLVSGTNIRTINNQSILGSGDITIEAGSSLTESDIAAMGFTKNTGTYSKPSGGIPKTDLASAVQTSLGKADTALQSYTEQYKGTVTGVKINGTTKNPSNGVVDLGTVITAHQTLKTINGQAIEGVGDITISGGEADWNATEGEAGYIENKPFNEPLYVVIPDTNQYTFRLAKENTTVNILCDGNSILHFYPNRPYNAPYECDDSEHYFDIDWDGNGTLYISETLAEESLRGLIEIIQEKGALNTDLIPNTVLKTTPQSLTDAQKQQILENLGISGGGAAGANVMAVDTGDAVEDVNISYATTDYVDGLIGDINSVLESIING